MRNGKLRLIAMVATVAMIVLFLLPGTALSHIGYDCRFFGPVSVKNCTGVIEVTAWLEGPHVGPWTATKYMHGGGLWYKVDIPRDNPSSPGKDGAVEGEEVHFGVSCGGVNYSAPSSYFARTKLIYHPLRLGDGCPLQGDVNMDGVVNVGDIIKEKRIIKGLDPLTPCADVNGDGSVDVGDIIKIKRIIKGIDC